MTPLIYLGPSGGPHISELPTVKGLDSPLAPWEAHLGARLGPERLWALGLHFCLWLSATPGAPTAHANRCARPS